MRTIKIITANIIALLFLSLFASCEKEEVMPSGELEFQLLAEVGSNIYAFNSHGFNFEDTLQCPTIGSVDFRLDIIATAGIQSVIWNLPKANLYDDGFNGDLPFATLDQHSFERKIFIHEDGDNIEYAAEAEWDTRGSNCSGAAPGTFEILVRDMNGQEVSLIVPIKMYGICL